MAESVSVKTAKQAMQNLAFDKRHEENGEQMQKLAKRVYSDLHDSAQILDIGGSEEMKTRDRVMKQMGISLKKTKAEKKAAKKARRC